MADMVDLPVIKPPKPSEEVGNLTNFLRVSGEWHKKHSEPNTGMLSALWYRGVASEYDVQAPGVYRASFTERAALFNIKGDIEEKRLRLEREMISNFRTAGAAFLPKYTQTEIYFSAQHFGLPTRLLDWSANPLAALFFACESHEDKDGKDGFVYAMDARKVIPDDAKKADGSKLWQSVILMHNPVVRQAVETSFWMAHDPEPRPYILPVRPDVTPGRIGQQSSCFTFHMHRAGPVDNSTLITIKIKASEKGPIRNELHRVNMNQFTAYYDLDHLSKEIKRGWGC